MAFQDVRLRCGEAGKRTNDLERCRLNTRHHGDEQQVVSQERNT